MADFTLDTSGEVRFPGQPAPSAHGGSYFPKDGRPVVWTDLDPFTQGYVEALLHGVVANRHYTDRGVVHSVDYATFRHLAPETLAAILRDCAALQTLSAEGVPNPETGGAWFWEDRQEGARPDFPPQTPYLGDDGLIYLREAA